MNLTERERKLLEKTVEQTQRVFDDYLKKAENTGDLFSWNEEMEQCEAIIKVIKYVLGGG